MRLTGMARAALIGSVFVIGSLVRAAADHPATLPNPAIKLTGTTSSSAPR